MTNKISPAHAAATKALAAQSAAKSAEDDQASLTAQLASLQQQREAPNLSSAQQTKLDAQIGLTQHQLSQVSAKLPKLEAAAEKTTTAAQAALGQAIQKDNTPALQAQLQQDQFDLNAVNQGEADRRLRGVAAPTSSPAGNALGGGVADVDLNGTKYTNVEGSAKDNNISINNVRKGFDPLKENGIALTDDQARKLGVKVGDTVKIRDTQTGKTVTATFYDSAGNNKADNLKHFEVDPALADALGIDYRNKNGKVWDKVSNGQDVDNRFVIEKNN